MFTLTAVRTSVVHTLIQSVMLMYTSFPSGQPEMNDFPFQSLCIQTSKTHFKHHTFLQISNNIYLYFTVCYIGLILNLRNAKPLNHFCVQGQQGLLYSWRLHKCYIIVSAQIVYGFISLSGTL